MELAWSSDVELRLGINMLFRRYVGGVMMGTLWMKYDWGGGHNSH